MKNKIKKIFVISSLTLCLSLVFNVSVNAYNTDVGGTSSIEISNNILDKAYKEEPYKTSSLHKTGYISTNYNTDLYHYEAPYQGYYSIYTDSEMDTVGKIYEHQNFLWWTTSYKDLNYNDDSSNRLTGNFSNISGNLRDFSMVQKFTKWENYIVAVRGYGDNTGTYNLIVEPNEDKRVNVSGGKWENNMLDNSSSVLGIWTSSKLYLTKDQVMALYYFANPVTRDLYLSQGGYDYSTLIDIYEKDPTAGAKILFNILSLIPGLGYVEGLTITLSGWMLDYVSNNKYSTILDMLHEVCGLEATNIGGNDNYTVKTGLLVETNFYSSGFPMYHTSFKSFDDNPTTILTGDKYCSGKWIY